MPGPNVLDLVGDIREAVERLPKEALVDILVYVFKEYVVEGPAPLATGAAPVQDDLTGMSFGEVMRALQLRLDLPELELFSVEDSGRVMVRAGGRPVPIELASTRGPELPVPPQPAPPPPVVVAPPTPAPVAARPAAAAPVENRPAAAAAAPRPAAATVESRPSASPAPSAPRAAAPVENRPAAAPAPAATASASKPEPARSGGLLEID